VTSTTLLSGRWGYIKRLLNIFGYNESAQAETNQLRGGGDDMLDNDASIRVTEHSTS
jgi:hypothetical protein